MLTTKSANVTRTLNETMHIILVLCNQYHKTKIMWALPQV